MTGHNSIKMADLSSLYHGLGFVNPETYIQSGNVIFSTEKDSEPERIAAGIESAIKARFGYDIPVMIRTVSQFRDILESNPFRNENNFDPAKMAVIFLHEPATESQIEKVAGIDYPPDMFKIIGAEIYTFCPNGFGKTKIYTNFFENKMKVKGTARNWKTITTLFNLAEGRNRV